MFAPSGLAQAYRGLELALPLHEALLVERQPRLGDAVLRAQGGVDANTTRPYDGVAPAAHMPAKAPVKEEPR